MQEGTPLTLWNAPDEASLALAVGVLGGAWLLLAGFPREAQRLKWAWARPRNLTTRNASETPQTMGVVLNHALGMFGLWTGLILAFQNAPQSLPWWSALAWMASGLGLRAVAGRLLVGPGDLASAWVEVTRHNHTWVGLALASWGVVASLNPVVREGDWGPQGVILLFSLAMAVNAFRATQLLRSSHPQRVVGILYLCVLEWSWSLFWILWSIRAALRGH